MQTTSGEYCMNLRLTKPNSNCIGLYIIGHYNPSHRISDLVSDTTYVVRANFIHKWRDLQFKVDSEQQIFSRNFSWQFYLLSEEFLPEIC